MATNGIPNSEKFTTICVKLSRNTPADKLKQLKFLLQDVTSEIDFYDEKLFLDLIAKLEAQEILNRDSPGRNEALLLCEMFDAISLHGLANEICSEFKVEKDPLHQKITSFRKFLVKLSDDLNQAPFIEKMKEYLRNKGFEVLHDVANQGICPLDIFQTMMQACLISANELSKLKEMMEFCSRNDLIQHIDQFDKNCGVLRNVYGLRNLPRDMVERPSEVNEILRLLTEGNNRVGVVGSRTGDVIGIRGMGGLGKTVLAQAIAWAASVSRQVIWLDIGQTPDCLALINILIEALGGASFSDMSTAQAWVKANTIDKDCLVVLDDVWNVDDAAEFDHLSGKCQLLITTRDAGVVRGLQGSALYELQTMAKDKSRTLLYQSARVTPDEQSKFSSNMQRIVAELLDQCRGLPLALSLVGSNLIDDRAEQYWDDILDDLKKADLVELRSLFPSDAYPYDNLLAAIDVSFQRLEKNAQEKFLDFAIFPEDTNVPFDILELLWCSEGAGRIMCDARAGRRILKVLERKSMIQKGSELPEKNSYRVHDLLLDFARAKLRSIGTLTDVQLLFLETLRGQCVNREWAKFKGNKGYYFKYLPYHLYSFEPHGEIRQLFFDYHWLEQKVDQTNLPSLISDFRFLEPLSHEMKLLKSSLTLSADVIENSKRPKSIGLQLLGRLLSFADEHPSINTLLEHVRETCKKTCHLLPLFSCLSEPIGPLIKIFSKNINDMVYSLATTVSATGAIVVAALGNGLIKIRELETGKELQVFEGHTMAVYCLALSHSGTLLASGSYDSTIILWNMDSFEQLFVLQGDGGYVNALDFSADDHRLFSGSNDGQLRVWRVATGERLGIIPAHDGQIRGLCTTKDGMYIATASLDHTIKLWRVDTLTIQATLRGHTHTVYSVVATGNDNPMLVSASGDKTLKIWDLRTYKEIRTLSDHQDEIYSVAVSSDTKHIISGGLDMIVRLWCFHTGKLLFCFKGHSQSVRFVTIIADGSKALSGSQDKTFRVWDLNTSAYLKQDRSRGHSEGVIDIAVARDGSSCVSSSMDGTFKIWNCKTAQECFTLKGLRRRAVNVAISADGRHLVSLSKDFLSSIKVWDMLHGSELSGIDSDNEPRIVRFSSDGMLVIIGCNNNHVFIWNWKNCDVPLKCVTLPFTTIEIACDRNMIYTCSRNMEVCQVNLDSLQVSTFSQGPNPSCTSMVVLPDGKGILSGITTESSFIYWELSTRREIKYNAGHSDDSIVTAIDITSNGKFALSGSSSGTLSLMNLESSKIVQSFAKTEDGIGIRLVSVLRSHDSFVFVDEANRIELRTFNNNGVELQLGQPAVKVTCVTPLGLNYILFGYENGELLLYDYVEQYEYKHHEAHSGAVSQVESHPNNEFLFFISGYACGSVKFWYVAKTVPPFWSQIWSHDNVHPHPITALAFVPGFDDIVVGSYGNEVHRINARGVVRTYKFKCYRIAALRVVEDSLIAACIHSFSAVKWNLDEGSVTKDFHSGAGREQVSRANHASNHVATKGSHHSLLFWNLETGRTLHRVCGHTHDIRALAFVPGGEFLLSGSRDKTLKLWNLRSGRFVEEFHFERFVRAIACASNGMVCVGLQGGEVCFLRFSSLSSHSTQLEQ